MFADIILQHLRLALNLKGKESYLKTEAFC
jgi:hypothetical protein